jgi:cation transport regulator
MPYKNNSSLPDSIHNALPQHAQEIYREAFNNAYNEYKDPNKRKDDSTREEVAYKVAWAAVKHKYIKDEKIKKWKAK